MLSRSSKKADLMKHNTQHMSQDNVVEVVTDYTEDVVVDDSMDAVEVNAVDTFMDNVEDAVEVDTENAVDDSMENAEVGNEVQGGGNFINVRVKVYTNMKHAENFIVRDGIYIQAREWPTGGLHNILRFDFKDINVQAVNEFNMYKEVVSQPTTKQIVVVLAVKNTEETEGPEKVQVMASVVAATARLSQGTEEDANCLSKAMGEGQNVVEDYMGIRDTDIASKVDEYSEDSNRKEVLAEVGEQLKVFPPAQREMKYRGGRAAERGGVHSEVQGEGQDEGIGEVLEDADKPHLPTHVLGVYWIATSATQSSSNSVDICNSRSNC